jgi:diphthamide biosynthesis methyltransferase
MLFMIGLGLGDERDITLRGLDAVKRCSKARRVVGFTRAGGTRVC